MNLFNKCEKLTRDEFSRLNSLVENQQEQQVIFLKNKYLDNVAIPYGTFGDISNKNHSKGGYGIEHIIQARYEKDKMAANEIAIILIAICETIKNGLIQKITNFKCVLEYQGISAILVKDHRYSTENWLLSGYKQFNLKKEETDFISSVSERYKYYDEFSRFQTHIGAITSYLNIIREKFDEINLTTLESKTTKQH